MLIGINGRINSGKDLIGKIIQSLDWYYNGHKESIRKKYTDIEYTQNVISGMFQQYSSYKIKKFADKLKDIVCILLGCTRKQLEDRDFKDKWLGEEWENHYLGFEEPYTIRKLLQRVGTEAGRNAIHPDIWVNATMADYKQNISSGPTLNFSGSGQKYSYPNWIITDVRFPNEAQAIKDREGIIIRVNRPCKECGLLHAHKMSCSKNVIEHESETALDNYEEFDYIIENSGTIEDLIKKIKEILIKERII